MKTANVMLVQGAHKTYPQWDLISSELTEKFEDFHTELRTIGYKIKACNVAVKDKKMFWILINSNGWYDLEHYATLLD